MNRLPNTIDSQDGGKVFVIKSPNERRERYEKEPLPVKEEQELPKELKQIEKK